MEVIRGELPTELSGYGSGSGDGYGYGYGYGYGSGSGDGYGDGSGDGYGYGYGYGSGSGDGYGYGSGDGYGYGSGDGDGSGYGYGYGDGSGYGSGYGSGSGDGMLEIASKQAAKRMSDPRFLALWKSDKDGRPANGGECEPVRPGTVHREKGPLTNSCGRGQLHATLNPEAWKGERLWIVALAGEVKHGDDKVWGLEREILEEVVIETYPADR